MDASVVADWWKEAFKPEPLLTVSEWADGNRILSRKSSSEPGRWRTERTPYLREIMDCLSVFHPCKKVVFKKPSQIGGTECGNNWIGYIIDHAPGPALLVQPTVDLSKRNSRLRIEPLIDESPTLKQKTKPLKSRDSSNTVLQKDFEGGTLVMTGANSAAGLRSMPARYIMFDEIDAYPRDVEGEGSPVSLALARSRTFSRRKAFFCSTPTFDGDSIIDDEFELSDKRFFEVPCPECNQFQVLQFKQLEWPEGKPEAAEYCCEHCGVLIDEKFKTKMLQAGKWVATNPTSKTPGFHLNSLYSPVGWFSWGEIASDYVEAKRQYEQEKKTEKMKTFTNTVLGLSYKEPGDAPEWKRLYFRREKFAMGVVPKNGRFLTCGVDVQKDRLEAEVIAWAPGFENWSVDYQVFNGETADEKVWNDLASYIEGTFPTEEGGAMPIQLCAIDSGYNTQHVYNFCRKYSPTRVVPVKGVDDLQVLVAQPRQVDVKVKGKPRVRRGVMFWNVGVNLIKSELYGWLKCDPPMDGEETPHGFCHFPEYGDEYFKQLCSERAVIRRDRKNRNIIEWVKSRERNEALDVRIYNRAAASLVGIDRFKPRDWDKFRVQGLAKSIETKHNRDATPKKPSKEKSKTRRESFW